MRRYAYRGLGFARNARFSVLHKNELLPEDKSALYVSIPHNATHIVEPAVPSVWHTRTQSGSSSSLGEHSNSSNSHQMSPIAALWQARHTPSLQANQEQVDIPPQTCIDELSGEFYDHLAERLAHLAEQQKTEKLGGGRAIGWLLYLAVALPNAFVGQMSTTVAVYLRTLVHSWKW